VKRARTMCESIAMSVVDDTLATSRHRETVAATPGWLIPPLDPVGCGHSHEVQRNLAACLADISISRARSRLLGRTQLRQCG
jgi:hypothetical protein